MKDLTFLLIGAQKCGTTWLANVIMQHPDVFTPAKELHFFNEADNYKKGISWYRKQFAGYNGEKVIGEFTPNYFWTSSEEQEIKECGLNRNIPKLVYKHYPNVKLIVNLRDPVKRAISAFYHHISAGRISPNSRIFDVGHRYGILSMGFYDVHLSKYFKVFPRDKFLIIDYENNIVINKYETIRRVYKFLEIEEGFIPKEIDKFYNKRNGHLYMRLNYRFPRLTKKLVKLCPMLNQIDFPRIIVSDEEINKLVHLYSKHIQDLSSLVGYNFTWSH